MARCSGLDLPTFPGTGFTSRVRMRAMAALAGSVVLHLSLASIITGGPVGGPRPTSARSVFQISLVEPAPQPAVSNLRAQDQHTMNAAPSAPMPSQVPQTPAAAAASASVVDRPPGSSAVLEGPDPTYYAARQLDVYPALVSELDLRASSKASSGSSARARLLLLIDEAGVVSEASIVGGEPASRFEAALSAFLSARFTPAYRDGRAVKSRVLVEVTIGEMAAH